MRLKCLQLASFFFVVSLSCMTLRAGESVVVKPATSASAERVADPIAPAPALSKVPPVGVSASSLTTQEAEEYRRIKLELQVQESVLKWAQWRFWGIAAIVLVVGFFGIRSLVRELIHEQLREAARATALTESATQQAQEAIRKSKNAVDTYKASVDDLQEIAAGIKKDLGALRAAIDAEGSNARDAVTVGLEGVQAQIDELSAAFKNFAGNGGSASAAIQLQEETKDRVNSQRKRFLARSKVKVSIQSNDAATELVEELRSLGYVTSVQDFKLMAIKSNTILFNKKRQAEAQEIARLVAEIDGSEPEMRPLPYRGVGTGGIGSDIYCILDGDWWYEDGLERKLTPSQFLKVQSESEEDFE